MILQILPRVPYGRGITLPLRTRKSGDRGNNPGPEVVVLVVSNLRVHIRKGLYSDPDGRYVRVVSTIMPVHPAGLDLISQEETVLGGSQT